ncbi:hypothetical protein ACFQ07_23235 [Actinomadura adrarensis]|uniref:Uncharacterized protein n=1 Tax=Actinomadura adrarensis TaxID=1819600 RepID=A0ABW3CN05_9ACTN
MSSDAMADFGEFAELAPVLVTLSRLQDKGLGKGAVLILPEGLLRGVGTAYGMPVVRADVPKPMIGVPGALQ